MSYSELPAITGRQLIDLLLKDGWQAHGQRTHGISMTKRASSVTLVTIIPDKTDPLPTGTLMAILSVKQTRLGRQGLIELLNKYGL